MEIRKIGYITAGLSVIIGVVLFLMLMGTISIDTSGLPLGSATFGLFGLTAILLFFGFCLLNNMEHYIMAIIDIVIGVIYAGIVILYMLIPAENAEGFFNIILYGTEAAGAVSLITIPFIIRTQSKLHRYFKYLVVVLFAITAFLGIGMVNTAVDIVKSGDISLFGASSEKTMKKIESLQSQGKTVVYLAFASFLGLVCTPMIGYASSDGLGGGGSNSPKLVPRNAATDPNMSTGINPNEGINYGDMPVPEGVVANTPMDVPPIEPVVTDPFVVNAPIPGPEEVNAVPAASAPEIAPSVDPNAANSVVEALTVPTTPVAANVAEPAPAPAPVEQAAPAPAAEQTTINTNEVAPDLQVLLNNNNNSN